MTFSLHVFSVIRISFINVMYSEREPIRAVLPINIILVKLMFSLGHCPKSTPCLQEGRISWSIQYLLIFFELTNTVSDNKIQITILILRRGALSKVCHFVIHSVEFYDVTLVNILGENQLKQLEQQNIVLNYNVKLRKLPQDRLLYETHEVRIWSLVRFTKTNICRFLNQIWRRCSPTWRNWQQKTLASPSF